MRSSVSGPDKSPGPGAYNVPPKFNDVPKYLLSKQWLFINWINLIMYILFKNYYL